MSAALKPAQPSTTEAFILCPLISISSVLCKSVRFPKIQISATDRQSNHRVLYSMFVHQAWFSRFSRVPLPAPALCWAILCISPASPTVISHLPKNPLLVRHHILLISLILNNSVKQNYFIKGGGVVNLSQWPGKHHTFPFPQFPLGQGRGKEELKQENLQVIIKRIVQEVEGPRKQVMQRQLLTTSHEQTDTQPFPKQKVTNLPKPSWFPVLFHAMWCHAPQYLTD